MLGGELHHSRERAMAWSASISIMVAGYDRACYYLQVILAYHNNGPAFSVYHFSKWKTERSGALRRHSLYRSWTRTELFCLKVFTSSLSGCLSFCFGLLWNICCLSNSTDLFSTDRQTFLVFWRLIAQLWKYVFSDNTCILCRLPYGHGFKRDIDTFIYRSRT